MSNLKIGPVDITSGTATLNAGGLKVGERQLVTEADGSVEVASQLKVFPYGVTEFNKGSGDGVCMLDIKGATGKDRAVRFFTESNLRWGLFTASGPETGSNAGSDLIIGRFSDAGAWVDAPLSISRATGVPSFGNGLTTVTRSSGDSTNFVATTAFVHDALASSVGGGVTAFNNRAGSVTLTSGDVVSALGTVVTKFNTRSGDVTLNSTDISTALGYIPVSPSSNGIRIRQRSYGGGGAAVTQDFGVITSPILDFSGTKDMYGTVTKGLGVNVSGSNIIVEMFWPDPGVNAGCIHPLNRINTTTGIKFAQDIRPGDVLVSSTGEEANVLSVIPSTLGSRKWFEINNSLVLTADHPIRLSTGWGILEVDLYKSADYNKVVVCKTIEGMKKVIGNIVDPEQASSISVGDILSSGEVISSIKEFEGSPTYPVLHFYTDKDSFQVEGISISNLGNEVTD